MAMNAPTGTGTGTVYATWTANGQTTTISSQPTATQPAQPSTGSQFSAWLDANQTEALLIGLGVLFLLVGGR